MPSCWSKMSALPLAAVVLVSLTAPGSASINLTGALMVPTTIAPRYCSGAFRYAARVGNSEISPLSAVQVFANDRRVARTRYSVFAMSGLGSERSRLHALNTMCGAR